MIYDYYNAKVDYDPKFDLLSVRKPDAKISYSMRFGSIIIDFQKQEPVGFEFTDAENFLKKLFNSPKLDKNLLNQVTKAKIGLATTQSNLIALIAFVLPNNQEIEAKYVLPKPVSQEIKITA